MFYETEKNDHGLPHDPYKSCVIPRPIGWITSLSRAGVLNLAVLACEAVNDHGNVAKFTARGECKQRVVGPAVVTRKKTVHVEPFA